MKPDASAFLNRLLRCAASLRTAEKQEPPFSLETRIISEWQRVVAARAWGVDMLSVFRHAAIGAFALAAITAATSISELFRANDPQTRVTDYALVASLDR